MKLSAVILAGGKSSRMGQDKGLIDYRGKLMVEYAIETCAKFTDTIFISTDNTQYAVFGYPLIPDNYREVGPIGGLEAALTRSFTHHNIVCPCDMPNIHPDLFDRVLQNSNGKSAVVVGNKEGKVFPVVGYYNKSALQVIQQQIKTGNYRMLSLLDELQAETVIISSEGWLSNFNYREDLQ